MIAGRGGLDNGGGVAFRPGQFPTLRRAMARFVDSAQRRSLSRSGSDAEPPASVAILESSRLSPAREAIRLGQRFRTRSFRVDVNPEMADPCNSFDE